MFVLCAKHLNTSLKRCSSSLGLSHITRVCCNPKYVFNPKQLFIYFNIIPTQREKPASNTISNIPTLLQFKIDLFLFYVINFKHDTFGPAVFYCHNSRTEVFQVLLSHSNPLLNLDFVIGMEMAPCDVFNLEYSNYLMPYQANRWDVLYFVPVSFYSIH